MWGPEDIKNDKSQHDKQYSISWLFKYQRPLVWGGLQRLAVFSPNLAPIPHPSLQGQGFPPRQQDLYLSVVGGKRGRPKTGRYIHMGVETWVERTETHPNTRQRGIILPVPLLLEAAGNGLE